MRALDHPVLIVGGGASGVLCAIQLLRSGTAPAVVLAERTGVVGPGVAYRTGCAEHLLNSPASRLSALPDDPGDFVRWAGAEPGDFLPRSWYGRYLADALAEAERGAGVRVSRVDAAVVAVRPGADAALQASLDTGDEIQAGHVVLATGSPASAPRYGTKRYVVDPWAPGALDRVTGDLPVLLLGTGLTAVDVALALTARDPRREVHAVSRHGLLPAPHQAPPDGSGPRVVVPPDPVTLPDLLRAVRHAVAPDPARWREAIDSLRAITPQLWARLGPVEQGRFLDRFGAFWDVHRHRMAPATSAAIARLRSERRLTVGRGTLLGLEEHPGHLRATLPGVTRDYGWVVDCTGFRSDVTATVDPLVRQLIDDDIARPDPLRLGLDVDAHGRLRGDLPIHAVGALRRGVLFETTAIPEIRAQARALAAVLGRGE